ALGVGLSETIPQVKNCRYDDAILIDVKEKQGIITGTNARSVLIGAYRYLREQGFVFLRPGKMGEHYPDNWEEKPIFVKEAASSRQRFICIEGACFYECVEDMIDWIPKVGMNGYFIQGISPTGWFKHWYDCEDRGDMVGVLKNPDRTPTPVTEEEILGMVSMFEEQIAKRSMLYSTIGHGFHCAPFGERTEKTLSDEEYQALGVSKYFAQLNGERKIHRMLAHTQACYGNKEVRDMIVKDAVQYCKTHPQADYINFWLADGENNYCECDLCRTKRPSDWFVMILNELDAALTAEHLQTRVKFCVYVDLIWPPLTERFKNPDRFVMTYCPISRSYSMPLPAETSYEMKEFELNKVEFPQSTEEYAAYINGWREIFDGECEVFDYYYMWDCYRDGGRMQISKIIHEDLANYDKTKFSGLVSCQNQRVFSPTALGMQIMARTLWNKDCDFDTECDDILKAEFGSSYQLAKEYLETMSECSMPHVMRNEKHILSEGNEAIFQKGLDCNSAFLSVIEEEIKKADEIQKLSWQHLKFYAQINQMMLEGFFHTVKNKKVNEEDWKKIIAFINQNDWEQRLYFDEYECKFMVFCIFGDLKRQIEKNQLGIHGDVTQGGI
ncbi:MAG: DUF4838 domain-containing protein, partial [Ruminococcaceae bacterium]|nr:DUF4838 domain-containing protein [Oscillospiraceae bacterium]